MKIPFLDLKRSYLELKSEFDNLWQDINTEGIYILGKKLEEFEREFANYLGSKHVIGVANGLDALVLSLRALGIGQGDEVIVPAHTYIASWLAVSQVGAIPIPVEIANNYLINASQIEQVISNKTKAIMPVHLYGNVCDMALIRKIAQKYSLKILEDAAQAHGAFDLTSMKKAGTLGDIAGFSFYPGKNLGCFGDGGCISTNDDVLAEKIRKLRNYGSKIRYHHEVIGVNSRLDELQAGVLSIKLRHLDQWNENRRQIAQLYLHELRNIDGLLLPEYNENHVWHIFAIKTPRRNELEHFLTKSGIGVNIHYPLPIYLQPAYKHMHYNKGDFVITENTCSEILSLPIGPHLKVEEAHICIKMIKEFFCGKNFGLNV